MSMCVCTRAAVRAPLASEGRPMAEAYLPNPLRKPAETGIGVSAFGRWIETPARAGFIGVLTIARKDARWNPLFSGNTAVEPAQA